MTMAAALRGVPPIVRELASELEKQFVHKGDRTRVFLPVGSLRTILGVNELERLVQAFIPQNPTLAAKLAKKLRGPDDDPSQGLLAAVATLVYCKDRFSIERLMNGNLPLPSLMNSQIPIESTEAERLFGSPFDKSFTDNQYIFSALVFVEGKDIEYLGDEAHCRLPYVEIPQPIGHGASGTVYKIKIANGHWRTDDRTMVNDSHKWLAQKVFHKSEQTSHATDTGNFSSELKLLKKMKNARRYNKNIMYHLGSLELHLGGGRDQYYIFFPLAEMNLWDFLNSAYRGEQLAPETMSEKAQLVGNACDLVGALAFIHEQLDTDYAMYHWDIKPDNVLLVKEGEKVVWKLADFGFAHGKNLPVPSMSSSGYFLQIDPQGFNQFSSARPTGGPGTYQAPEVDGSPRSRTGYESDIWSVGCVLAILYSYLDDGPRGVNEFWEKRNRGGDDAAPEAEIDYFYRTERSGPETTRRLYEGVTEWFSILRQRARRRSEHRENRHEGRCVDLALRYLEENTFLIDRQRRKKTKASMLQEHLWKLRGFYSTGTEKVASLRSSSTDSSADEATIDSAYNISQGSTEQRSDNVTTLEPFITWPGFSIDPNFHCEVTTLRGYESRPRNSSDGSPRSPSTPAQQPQSLDETFGRGSTSSASRSLQLSEAPASPRCTHLCSALKPGCEIESMLDAIRAAKCQDPGQLSPRCPVCSYAPLHRAVLKNNKILVEELMRDTNINPNEKDKDGRTPFTLSIANGGKPHAIRALLKYENVIIDKAKFDEVKNSLSHDVKDDIKRELKRRR